MRTENSSAPTRHGIVPPASNVGPEAMYSGLMECPCTDKYPKVISSFSTMEQGNCKAQITQADRCFSAALELGLTPVTQNISTTTTTTPSGCYVTAVSGGFEITYNGANSTVACGAKGPARVLGLAQGLVHIRVDLIPTSAALAGGLATITLTGPSDLWFGVGFGASDGGSDNGAGGGAEGLTMSGTNYTIVVLGNGTVVERKLGQHLAGTVYF